MTEKIPTQEMPGKIYTSIRELTSDINQYNDNNREKIGGKEDIANPLVLRVFGKQLAKFVRDGKEFWEISDGPREKFISALIYSMNDNRINLNFVDYRPWQESGGKEKAVQIQALRLDNQNIKDYRIQVAIKTVKLNKR